MNGSQSWAQVSERRASIIPVNLGISPFTFLTLSCNDYADPCADMILYTAEIPAMRFRGLTSRQPEKRRSLNLDASLSTLHGGTLKAFAL